jgi:hypothetical protein
MMITYEADGIIFDNYDDYLKHECVKLGITKEQYKYLKELERREKMASHAMLMSATSHNRIAFDRAVFEVISFRKRLGLDLTCSL